MYLGVRVQGGRLTDEHITFSGDEHILIIGPTRSGKSRRLLAPNLAMDTRRSALVIDIKGELHRWTAAHRARSGHRIITLNPFGLGDIPSTGFNPLAGLDPASPEFVDEASGLAEAIIEIPDKDPHWAESARDILSGLIMYERCRNGPAAALTKVRAMITKAEDELAEVAIDAVANVEAPGGKELGWHEAIANKLRRLVSLSPEHRELMSILSTAKTQTEFLDSDLIAADLAKGGFDFATMKRALTTVYLILPPKHLYRHAKWLRLVIDAAIRDLQRELRRPGEPDVLFLLDEFAQLGTMRSIETSMSLNAGYGIKVVAAIQHLGQLQHHYAQNWETFLSGGLITAFAPRDVLTSEHLSKLSGQEWIETTSTTKAAGSGSTTTAQTLAPSIMAHEFRRMPRGMMIAFVPTAEGQVMRRIMTRDAADMADLVPATVRQAMAA